MLKAFENWLLNNNYKPTTAFDYQGRIERLCRAEGYTLSHLVENIALILPEYEINGKKSSYGKRSHTSVRQALRRFKMFLTVEKLVKSHAKIVETHFLTRGYNLFIWYRFYYFYQIRLTTECLWSKEI